MPGYDKIARDVDEDDNNELEDIQIENLYKLKEYDYWCKCFDKVLWNNTEWFNTKFKLVDSIDK